MSRARARRARCWPISTNNVDEKTEADRTSISLNRAILQRYGIKANQESKCFYHRGTRKNDRVHGEGKWLRFARSLTRFLREAPKSLPLRALGRSSLFLCDRNTCLPACLRHDGGLELGPLVGHSGNSPGRRAFSRTGQMRALKQSLLGVAYIRMSTDRCQLDRSRICRESPEERAHV